MSSNEYTKPVHGQPTLDLIAHYTRPGQCNKPEKHGVSMLDSRNIASRNKGYPENLQTVVWLIYIRLVPRE